MSAIVLFWTVNYGRIAAKPPSWRLSHSIKFLCHDSRAMFGAFFDKLMTAGGCTTQNRKAIIQ
jgi:hypothetical protein